MRETGVVKSVEGEFCTCATRRKSTCGDNCATCKAVCSSREHIFTAKNTAGAKEGDTVIIEMPTRSVLKSAFLVYILPLVAFLLGFSYFFGAGKPELEACFWGIVLGGAMWVLASFYGKYKKLELTPEVCEIVEE